MSKTGRYVEELAYKYLSSHPELSWEDAMKIVCKRGFEDDEKEVRECFL